MGKIEYHTLNLSSTLQFAIKKILKQRKCIWEQWTVEAIDVANDKLVVKRYINDKQEDKNG